MDNIARIVLDLLVSEKVLVTGDAWDQALSTRLVRHQDSALNEQETDARASVIPSVRLVAVVERILPQLSDYKTFYENVYGLLQFCQQEYPHDHFNMVCEWLMAPSSSPAFRCWLYAYVNNITNVLIRVDGRRWKQALVIAAFQENDPHQKLTVLKLIDLYVGSLKGIVEPCSVPPNKLLQLLRFYWTNATTLSHSTTLCAAKVVALVREPIVPNPQVLTLLRWGQVLQPLFFDNFMAALLTMQAIRRPHELELNVPTEIETYFGDTTSIRTLVQRSQETSRQLLISARQRHINYVYRSPDQTACWINLYSPSSELGTSSAAVISYLRTDLVDLPQELFSPVFAGFAMLGASILRDGEQVDSSTKLMVESLLGLVMLRSDALSLLSVLSVILDLHIASLAIWDKDSALFRRYVAELSEAVILEIDETKKWIIEITLHHLVMECDTAVLTTNAVFLRERLPHKSWEFVRPRVGW